MEQRLKNVREENDNYRRRHQEQEMPQAPPTNVPASVREKPTAAEERINVVQEEQRKQDNIKEEQRRERIKDENEAEQRRLDRINAERARSH